MQSVLLILLLAQTAGAASKCGSEVKWETSLDRALDLAAKANKPVCWYVPTLRGSPMDRKQIIDNYMMMGPFMSADVVDILSRRFVPLRAEANQDAADRYKIRPVDFIEPGLILLRPDGRVLHRMDRLYTYNEEWFADQLFLALGENECEMRLGSEKDPLRRAGLLRRLRRPKEALAELDKLDDTPAARLERGILRIKQHRYREAEPILAKLDDPQALHLRACALYLTAREAEAEEIWRGLAASDSRWAWKADAELRREGPFTRGFEEIGWLPDDAYGKPRATTDLPRSADDLDAIARRGVEFLLKHQRSSGAWDDTNYDYAGKDSLPDVRIAVTALSALALWSWRDIDPGRIDAALKRADACLQDEANLAKENTKERAWAHLYRLLYWSARGGPRENLQRAVAGLRRLQRTNGIWFHEYPNPFVTASALHALDAARRAGTDVDPSMVRRGARALASCRFPDGIFSYGHPRSPAPVQSSSGRMPVCEHALFLNGMSDVGALEAAVERAFAHQPLRERVRKYDDHTNLWQIGGFFFYYDLLGISHAADALPQEKRGEVHSRLRRIVLSAGEIDGSWMDSHEVGKAYGTAAALIILRRAGN